MSQNSAPKATISDSRNLYFGYGSNLWLHQMKTRCPESSFVGIACLRNYRWMINERGSANPVPCDPSSDAKDEAAQVWGIVYALTKPDEEFLDGKEGVPDKHTKEVHDLDFWRVDSENVEGKIDVSVDPEKIPMLLYIDRKRTADDKPREEYVYRMNMGIADALKVGIPSSYVEKVMRNFIPKTNGSLSPELTAQVQKQIYR